MVHANFALHKRALFCTTCGMIRKSSGFAAILLIKLHAPRMDYVTWFKVCNGNITKDCYDKTHIRLGRPYDVV